MIGAIRADQMEESTPVHLSLRWHEIEGEEVPRPSFRAADEEGSHSSVVLGVNIAAPCEEGISE